MVFLYFVLLILGAMYTPIFTLGCVVMITGNPVIGFILILFSLGKGFIDKITAPSTGIDDILDGERLPRE